jgi:hypothetical protein
LQLKKAFNDLELIPVVFIHWSKMGEGLKKIIGSGDKKYEVSFLIHENLLIANNTMSKAPFSKKTYNASQKFRDWG